MVTPTNASNDNLIRNPYSNRSRTGCGWGVILFVMGCMTTLLVLLLTNHGYHHRKEQQLMNALKQVKAENHQLVIQQKNIQDAKTAAAKRLDSVHAMSNNLGAVAESAGEWLDTIGRLTDEGLKYVASADQDETVESPPKVAAEPKLRSSNSKPKTLTSSSLIVNAAANKEKDDDDDARVCKTNPYVPSLAIPPSQIGQRMDKWLDDMDLHLLRASNDTVMKKKTHARFFPFEEMAPCSETSCTGSCGADEAKTICGYSNLKKTKTTAAGDEKPCVVYSLGGNNQWGFERHILEDTDCEVHTFDCTGPRARFSRQPKDDRSHFHHVCIGAESLPADKNANCTATATKSRDMCGPVKTLKEVQKELGHGRIDLFKIDIEGFEWPIFEQWPELTDPESKNVVLPMQILVEIHYTTPFPILLKGQSRYRDWKFAKDMVGLQKHFLQMGYAVAARDDNEFCNHCTELTLLRIRC